MITMTDNEIERCGFMINKYVLVAVQWGLYYDN